MKNKFITIAVLGLLASIMFSCVPAKKFEDERQRKQECEAERRELLKENEKLSATANEYDSELQQFRNQIKFLERDTLLKSKTYQTLTRQYDKINELYEQLLENTEKLRAGSRSETEEALRLLQLTRDDLQRKEDELRLLEDRLNKERNELNKLQSELRLKEDAIAEKNKRVQELESVLAQKDSIMNALRDKVLNALKGYEGDGLTVTQKDGKVYVSLDEKLLFKSGKWIIDPKGQDAITKLAKVLETNEDIQITIEGHTDHLAYRGNGSIEDNWDLSAKRATSIVKLILNNSNIKAKRLTASGRGEFVPLNDGETPEERAANRRTEIILTPDLGEIFELFNN